VDQAAADVRYATQWLHGWLSGRIDVDLRGLESTLAARTSELHAHRLQLLQQWVAARWEGPMMGGGSAAPAAGVAIGVPAATAGVQGLNLI
jgi:hypothetical protein